MAPKLARRLLYAIAAACLAVTAAIALLKPPPLPAPQVDHEPTVISGPLGNGSTQRTISVNGVTEIIISANRPTSSSGYVCLPPRTKCTIVSPTPHP